MAKLALWPEFSAQAKGDRRCESRHEAWAGLLVLTAGPVQYFYRRYPTGPVASSLPD